MASVLIVAEQRAGKLNKATLAALWNLPYCIKRRQVCKAEDFELPLR